MDKIQRKFIDENIDELVENTRCTAKLLTMLQQERVLSSEDYENLVRKT